MTPPRGRGRPPYQYPYPSHYQYPPQSQHGRRRPSSLRVLALLVLAAVVVVGGVGSYRVVSFLHDVANLNNPLQLIQSQIDPPAGSIAYKLKHGQRVNILALGYGGAENDSPYLTDTIMAISIDPATGQVMESSIPRDLWVDVDGWQDGQPLPAKINTAFEVPTSPTAFGTGPLRAQYQGKDGPGHLAEATVGSVTGLTFDRYVAVDFKAFRQVVDDLGGITVTMTGPLDDCHYPDYHDGYVNHGVPVGYACPPGAGIHFPAGTYRVNGEQALEIARSRDAIEPDQATDFARANRQQLIVAAIKKKATSIGALPQAPQLMSQLQSDFRTDMDLADIQALYGFLGKLPDSAIGHFAVTDQNLVQDFNPYTAGSCGPSAQFVLCPIDPTYRLWATVFANLFVPPQALAEKAPVQLVNASISSPDMHTRMTNALRPLGLQLADGVRHRSQPTSVVYDYSGGKYPQTAAWLQRFFGAEVQQVTPNAQTTFVPAAGEQTSGLVVVMGSDFARRWFGIA